MYSNYKNISVMLVDDDDQVLESLMVYLEDLEFPVTGFTCPSQALQAIQKSPPTVCLVDLRLTNTSGEELIKDIRRTSPVTRCLIYSGSCYRLSPELEALGMTQHDVLQKPIQDFDLLVKKIAG